MWKKNKAKMKKSHSYMDNSQISMDCMIRTDKCWFRIQTQVPHTSLCYKHMQIFSMKKSVTEKYENKPLFLYLYTDHWYRWNTPIFYWWYNIKILIFPHIYIYRFHIYFLMFSLLSGVCILHLIYALTVMCRQNQLSIVI